MIPLAWLWLRYQPGSELAEWFRKRVGMLAGRTRRIAIVAIPWHASCSSRFGATPKPV